MPDRKARKRDFNQEAVRQVNKLTDSEPVNGEDLLESKALKRKLREAKASVSRGDLDRKATSTIKARSKS